ncbi:MAG: plasma-membrane proton-efflux P-type ATPase, partial [Saprospiraceae bacterium]|nr:plasma-membrane proton-efflux P-type ATPase [Saprospiraceae bacterium]
LQFALVLTVASIPVAMPTVLSVTMAVGAKLLATKQAIVSKLVSIEELAGMDILCTDKTGTLTQNKLTVGQPFTHQYVKSEDPVLIAALASESAGGDPIDNAIMAAMQDTSQLKQFTITQFTPFDPVHKRTEASVIDSEGLNFKVSKGAAQVILGMTTKDDVEKQSAEKAIEEFAAKGFRSLGVAKTNEIGEWKLVGILPLFDPPRIDAKEMIATALELGVKVKMVTGDAIAIAKQTATELGMHPNILDAVILGDRCETSSLEHINDIESADGFAQVFPEHKFCIVKALQEKDHIVGMTGDGVNDAPALKKADCGVAVSGATDAARAAASIVLMTPGLSVIIDAIKESRRIFQRMNSYTIYRITETLRVLFFMTLSILVFNFYPVTAIMIVLLALLNDGAILTIAFDHVKYKNIPESWDMRSVLRISTILGITGVVATFGLFYLGEKVFLLDRDMIQSLIYLKLSVAGQLTIFITRTRGPFWSIPPVKAMVFAVATAQVIATLVAVYGILMTPIGWKWAGFVWLYAIVWFIISDIVKRWAYKGIENKLSISSQKPIGAI